MFPGPSVGIAWAGSVQYFPLHLLRPLLADSSIDPFEQPSCAAHPRTPFSTVRTADKAVNCCKQASHLVDVFYFRAIAQLSFPTLSFSLCATYSRYTAAVDGRSDHLGAGQCHRPQAIRQHNDLLAFSSKLCSRFFCHKRDTATLQLKLGVPCSLRTG